MCWSRILSLPDRPWAKNKCCEGLTLHQTVICFGLTKQVLLTVSRHRSITTSNVVRVLTVAFQITHTQRNSNILLDYLYEQNTNKHFIMATNFTSISSFYQIVAIIFLLYYCCVLTNSIRFYFKTSTSLNSSFGVGRENLRFF